jgi:hypothetical protein
MNILNNRAILVFLLSVTVEFCGTARMLLTAVRSPSELRWDESRCSFCFTSLEMLIET